MNHEIKKEETNSEITRGTVENILEKVPVDQLLGSVTTYPEGNDKNQSLRSSARVFKKIKLDANWNAGPSTSYSVEKIVPEKKEEQKPETTSQKEQKKLKPSWSVEDRVLFFEALNEYGKDFENIHNYIVQKLKKKGVPDNLLITKDHVRHLYYKTWHKISKYLKFSEGTKKTVQELYGLINYGELRKKVGVFTQKINHKLNELIYNGCVAIRVKGKMVRIKTPMCAALRQLNKLDDKDDDLKLPSRVLVELRPKDMSTFLKVQTMALNPRIRTVLPLQKKLSTLLTCVSKKWKAAEIEYLKNLYPLENGEAEDEKLDFDSHFNSSQLKFTPPKGIRVNVPKANINEYFTRESVCLKAFEEKMGIDRSKHVLSLMLDKKENKKPPQKSRADSFSEAIVKSPIKSELQNTEKQLEYQQNTELVEISTSNNNGASIECSPLHQIPSKTEIISSNEENGENLIDKTMNNSFSNNGLEHDESKKVLPVKTENDVNKSSPQSISKVGKLKKENQYLDESHAGDCSKNDETVDNNRNNISDEEQLNKLSKIQNGWTVHDCDTLTIGELYLMFGSASKVVLEYHWTEKINRNISQDSDCSSSEEKVTKNPLTDSLKHFGFTDALRKLVSLVKLQQKKVAPKCPCGHVCSPKNVVPKKNQNKSLGDLDEKANNVDEYSMETDTLNPVVSGEEKQKNVPFNAFLRPQSKPPAVHLMAQLDSIQKLKPKYSVRKGRRLRTKQLVVERELPLMPKANSAHQIVRMNIISESSSNKPPVSNIEDQCEVDTQTVKCGMENFVENVLNAPESDTQHTKEEKREPNIEMNSNMDIQLELSGEIPVVETTDNLSVLLQDSSRSLSPSGILKENQWISSEVGDFSLSSFLGHLESPLKSQDEASHDVDAQVRSLLTENSFDYTAKFADLANKVVNDTAN